MTEMVLYASLHRLNYDQLVEFIGYDLFTKFWSNGFSLFLRHFSFRTQVKTSSNQLLFKNGSQLTIQF